MYDFTRGHSPDWLQHRSSDQSTEYSVLRVRVNLDTTEEGNSLEGTGAFSVRTSNREAALPSAALCGPSESGDLDPKG